MNRKTDLSTEINRGADICRRIKKIMMPTASWSRAICDRLAVTFTDVKRKGRILYPQLTETEMLVAIAKYTDEDFLELLDLSSADSLMAAKS